MDACVALRSLCECIRARRRRASLSLSSLTSSNGTGDTSTAAGETLQDIRLDGKFEVILPTIQPLHPISSPNNPSFNTNFQYK